MKKSITTLDNVKIHYEITKGKLPLQLIFIHGMGGDLHSWDMERKVFDKKGYTTVAVD